MKRSTKRPQCEVFPTCGGCRVLDVPYAKQLEDKARTLRESLREWAPSCRLEKPLVGRSPYYGRAKASYPLAFVKGGVQVGFYSPGSHQIVESDACITQTPALNEATKRLRSVLSDLRPSIYRERQRKGWLRHLVMRHSITHDELVLTLVTTSETESSEKQLVDECMQALGRMKVAGSPSTRLRGIVKNINNGKGNAILGDQFQNLWGRPYIEEEVLGLTVRISAGSFYQVHPELAEAMYAKVIDMVERRRAKSVVDAYSGIGVMALLLAKRGLRVSAIESSPQAILDVKENKRRANQRVDLLSGDVERHLPPLLKRSFDAVILDPPRAGASSTVLDALIQTPPRFIIYVACGWKSFRRDVQRLQNETSLRLTSLTPVDLFPHTEHVEVLGVLESPQ